MANTRPTSSAGSNTGSIARAFAGQRVALVRYTARLLNGDASRAEFVVQAALDELLASPPDDPTGDEAELCFAACHQQAHAIARPEDRTKLFAEAPAGPAQTGAEDHTALLRQIERLTPKQQEVVRLKFQNGFGHAAIARIIDLPRDKVGALMHTAIARLREDDSSQTPVTDSRITARALDEQTEPERDAFALALREDPSLDAKVTEVRTFAARIEEALAIESGARAPRRPPQGSRKNSVGSVFRFFGSSREAHSRWASELSFFSARSGKTPIGPIRLPAISNSARRRGRTNRPRTVKNRRRTPQRQHRIHPRPPTGAKRRSSTIPPRLRRLLPLRSVIVRPGPRLASRMVVPPPVKR